MKRFLKKFSLLILLTATGTGQSLAKEIQDHESIREAARSYAYKIAELSTGSDKIQVKVGSLDSRLRLAKCDRELEAFESPNTKSSGRTTLGVRCPGKKPWKLYVPVNIQVVKKIAALRQSLPKNTAIEAQHLQMIEKDTTGLHRGYYTDARGLLGKLTKRTLKSGTIITPANIVNPMAIKKGSVVIIMAELHGIQVRMKGKALKSGAAGDWISVKNLSSNRKVEGRVLGSGVVQVTL